MADDVIIRSDEIRRLMNEKDDDCSEIKQQIFVARNGILLEILLTVRLFLRDELRLAVGRIGCVYDEDRFGENINS